jgi:hypothetical protein
VSQIECILRKTRARLATDGARTPMVARAGANHDWSDLSDLFASMLDVWQKRLGQKLISVLNEG